MSVLYVCDGCDHRAQGVQDAGTRMPGRWTARVIEDRLRRRFTLHACSKPECVTKVSAIESATEPLPF